MTIEAIAEVLRRQKADHLTSNEIVDELQQFADAAVRAHTAAKDGAQSGSSDD